MNLTEIAELLGLARGEGDKLVRREATFPAPVAVLANRTRVWERSKVEAWSASTGFYAGRYERIPPGAFRHVDLGRAQKRMTEIIDRMKPGEWESLLLPDKEDDPDWREPSPFEAEIEPDSCDDESEERD
jgi:predicted DNA-binding transcriptional regulator AlpA